MSTPDDRPIFDWRELVSLLYDGPATLADAIRAGMYDIDVQAAVLRMLGVQIDLRKGNYSLPRTEQNMDRLLALLEWAEGRQHG